MSVRTIAGRHGKAASPARARSRQPVARLRFVWFVPVRAVPGNGPVVIH